MRCVDLLVAVSCADAQTLPDAVAPLVSTFRTLLDDAGPVDSSVAESLASTAAARLAREVSRDQLARSTADAESAAAMDDAKRLKFVGGCAREMRGCPFGWQEAVAGNCAPPAWYEGGCVATDVSEYSDNQKELFAMSCEVAWPCRDCKTDFHGCPIGWGTVGKLCVAPPT